ncbi:cobalamin B12-binding domain-containing protein [Cloacibacillus evryensis]|uniref:cobalamin B12-binding domain-containing protein n=1 Tax=Cloacibacillus evryensis TaxID=508460 RepID=UPI00210B0D93|nr:cobalamin-dependent protein [Cloacibacillus evryensis]MCQ4764310.1 cobalamin-dependent protein [Cloacibacillus evryensis]
MSIAQVRQYMVDGDGDAAVALVNDMLAKGTAAQEIMNGLTEEMGILGQKFENFEVFLPDLMIAGDAFMQIMSVLKEHLVAAADGTAAKTVIIGTVKGDYHDIGKNIVGIVLQANGFNVVDLGADIDPVAYLDAARKEKADVVGLSALMTTTMPGQEEFIKLVKDAGEKGKYLVCVGGAPTSVEWAERIGADVWSFDAFECAAKLKKLLG